MLNKKEHMQPAEKKYTHKHTHSTEVVLPVKGAMRVVYYIGFSKVILSQPISI